MIALAALLTACAAVQVEHPDPTDPFEGTNRSMHGFNDALDRNIMLPIARGYRDVAPEPVRDSVTNFFDNLGYLNVIANDLLQVKIEQFLYDSARFVINSSIGLGGLFDQATPLGLVEHEEDLGQTFGTWGAGEGAYLVIPFFGPNSVRDAPDLATSWLLNPLTYVTAVISWPLTLFEFVNTRANLIDSTEFVAGAAIDEYSYIREAYRQRREFLIHDGNPPMSDFDEFIEGDGDDEGVLKIF